MPFTSKTLPLPRSFATHRAGYFPAGFGAAALVVWTTTGYAAGADPAAPAVTDRQSQSIEAVLGERADPLADIERQIQAREHDYAARWLEDHVRTVEAGTHRYDPALIRPLTLLGDAYRGLDKPVQALSHYQRAVHLTRVNAGLNAPEQVEIVYREADTLKALGQYEEANEREEYAYHILVRNHEPLDQGLLPGIYHLAGWYQHTNNVFAARALYEHALEIIHAHGHADTLKAVPAWHGIATTYRMERYPPYYVADLREADSNNALATTGMQPMTVNNFPEGEQALQRIVQIHQQQPQPDPVRLSEAVLELADWYTLFDKARRAEPLYEYAWELLEQAPDVDVVSYFAEPRLLYFPVPDAPTPPPLDERGELATGYVEIACEVSDRGYVRGLTTVAAVPEGLMEYRVRKSLRVARYRPVLVDGVPVARNAHTYRYEFPYYLERAEPDADGEAERYRASAKGTRASG